MSQYQPTYALAICAQTTTTTNYNETRYCYWFVIVLDLH